MEITVNVVVECLRCHHEFETGAVADVGPQANWFELD